MAVEAIRLQNFMAFEDTGWVELRPITLLFGRNSSGKSAVTRALRLLKQSLDAPFGAGPFVLESRYGVDLGSFRNMVYGNAVERQVCFHFSCASPALKDVLTEYAWSVPQADAVPTDRLDFSLGYGAYRQIDSGADVTRVVLQDVQVRLRGNGQENGPLLFQAGLLEPHEAKVFGADWYTEGLLANVEGPDLWSGFNCGLGRGFLPVLMPIPRASAGYACVDSLVRLLNTEIASFLRSIVHIGPIRPEPQRRYSFDRESVIEWQERGWGEFLAFVAGQRPRIEHDVDRWFGELQLGEGVRGHPVSPDGALIIEYEIGVPDRGMTQPLPLSATGFGASQVLPIVVQGLQAQPGAMVVIEQPELHLHPSAQAVLGDLFIHAFQREAWRTWRDEVARAERDHVAPPPPPRLEELLRYAPRFLIETHSEHLLLRLRRRVAEASALRTSTSTAVPPAGGAIAHPDQLLPDCLRVHFISREPGNCGSEIVQIGVNEWGELDLSQAPPQFDDFFADDLIEIGALARAVLGGEA